MSDTFDDLPIIHTPELEKLAESFKGGFNYRIIKKDYPPAKKGGETASTYAIHEVWYDEEGNPTSYTENPVYPQGECWSDDEDQDETGLESLRYDLELYTDALEKPILKHSDFPLEEEK